MQTVYQDQPLGIHGALAEAYPHAHVTGLASAGIINVGTLAIYDTTAGLDPKSVRAPTATGQVTTLLGVVGLVRWDPTYPEPPYRVGASLPIMRKGRMYIQAETALVAHTNPFVRFVAGAGGTILGSLRGDVDGASAVAAPYIQVIVGAAAGGISIVEISL